MKTTIAILFILLLFFGYDNIRLRSEIKPFNDTLSQSDSIYRLRCGTFKRDSLIQIGSVFFRNEKEFNNFYQFYNQNK